MSPQIVCQGAGRGSRDTRWPAIMSKGVRVGIFEKLFSAESERGPVNYRRELFPVTTFCTRRFRTGRYDVMAVVIRQHNSVRPARSRVAVSPARLIRVTN